MGADIGYLQTKVREMQDKLDVINDRVTDLDGLGKTVDDKTTELHKAISALSSVDGKFLTINNRVNALEQMLDGQSKKIALSLERIEGGIEALDTDVSGNNLVVGTLINFIVQSYFPQEEYITEKVLFLFANSSMPSEKKLDFYTFVIDFISSCEIWKTNNNNPINLAKNLDLFKTFVAYKMANKEDYKKLTKFFTNREMSKEGLKSVILHSPWEQEIQNLMKTLSQEDKDKHLNDFFKEFCPDIDEKFKRLEDVVSKAGEKNHKIAVQKSKEIMRSVIMMGGKFRE